MNMGNKTAVLVFTLVGFSVPPHVQGALFVAFLLVYFITLFGNLLIAALITVSPNLHTPMYFFLFHVSCLDIGSSSVTVPRLLLGLVAHQKCISFSECIAQVFGFIFLGTTEVFILCAMCYDRYVAICLPLNYAVIMSPRFCVLLLAISGVAGFTYSFVFTMQLSQLPFCGEIVIDHFVCEIPALLKVACADTSPNETVIFALTGTVAPLTLVVIVMSYAHIVRVILKMPSADGRSKAFSTCSAHLVVVLLFYASGAGTYLKPSHSSLGYEKLVSLFYTVFVPMLNPMIYSLRNEEVKKAAQKVMHQVGNTLRCAM
ncbi:hypothetical protein NDU88_008966 [Pleurodeles waltl]|uniref:Olfactory receptor n=1 Tax=Pleurodeles waltl TaxID=8319 RepID=A0AAV7NAF0_PLEWA|nr:hypothetical protein NDU88_008966 [Pleurodeles waltl]